MVSDKWTFSTNKYIESPLKQVFGFALLRCPRGRLSSHPKNSNGMER
jgi:hypothetical protein